MRHRHPATYTVSLSPGEAWQLLNAAIVRRGTLDGLQALGHSDVLESAVGDLDRAQAALERAMGLIPERRHDDTWSEAELREAWGR